MKTGIQIGKGWKSESQERPEVGMLLFSQTFRLTDFLTYELLQTASCLAVTTNQQRITNNKTL